MEILKEYQHITRLVAKHKGQSLTTLECFAIVRLFSSNLMTYSGKKSTYQVAMLTFIQIMDCFKTTGEIKIHKWLLVKNGARHRSSVDKVT